MVGYQAYVASLYYVGETAYDIHIRNCHSYYPLAALAKTI